MNTRTLTALLALLIASHAHPAFAEEFQIDVTKLTQETQQLSQSNKHLTMVWWIPGQFWQASFAQDSSVTEQQTEEFLEVLEDYTILAVVDGQIGTFGGITYQSRESIESTLRLIDANENEYAPLTRSEISADATNFLGMMKPVFANMLGAMGENMNFFAFPATDENGVLIADPVQEGSFAVKVAEETLSWRLPLGSVLAPKLCPVDGEKLSGAWNYCPYHGNEL